MNILLVFTLIFAALVGCLAGLNTEAQRRVHLGALGAAQQAQAQRRVHLGAVAAGQNHG